MEVGGQALLQEYLYGVMQNYAQEVLLTGTYGGLIVLDLR